MIHPSFPAKTYLTAYAALLVLLLANVFINYLNFGWGNMFVALVIAICQASIVVFVMMHGLFERVLIRLVMAGALVWFMILVTLTFTDYITRNWVPVAGK